MKQKIEGDSLKVGAMRRPVTGKGEIRVIWKEREVENGS